MRRLLATATLALTLACNLDTATDTNDTEIAGTYTLQTIDGSPLPYTFTNGADTFVLLSDAIIIRSDGTWSEPFTYRQTISGQITNGSDVDGGTWTRSGDQVQFISAVFVTVAYTGTLSGSTLTLSDGARTQIFVR